LFKTGFKYVFGRYQLSDNEWKITREITDPRVRAVRARGAQEAPARQIRFGDTVTLGVSRPIACVDRRRSSRSFFLRAVLPKNISDIATELQRDRLTSRVGPVSSPSSGAAISRLPLSFRTTFSASRKPRLTAVRVRSARWPYQTQWVSMAKYDGIRAHAVFSRLWTTRRRRTVVSTFLPFARDHRRTVFDRTIRHDDALSGNPSLVSGRYSQFLFSRT